MRGTPPRINIARPDRLIARLPVYASVNSEFVRIEQRQFNTDRTLQTDDGLNRFDIVPAVRFPFNKLAFLTFNTTAQFRNTFWTDSLLTDIVNGIERPTLMRLDAPISRRFVELSADVNGPTLVRIWDAPKSTYAQRFRHSIEPFAQVLYRTAIDNYIAIPKLEGTDSIVGSATSYTYGMNTRFYAKRTVDGPRAIPREVISASIQQTYNTERALDPLRRGTAVEQHRAHVALHAGAVLVRTSPFDGVDGHVQDRLRRTVQPFPSFSADAGWEDQRISLIASWSNRALPSEQPRPEHRAPDPLLQLVHEPALSAEPLRRHALAQLGRQDTSR